MVKNKSKNWELVKLGDVADIRSSKRIFRDEYVLDGIPFYRGKEITELSNQQNISTPLFISSKRYSELVATSVIPQLGDILLTSVGTIGNAYMVSNNDPFYFKDGNITWIRDFSTTIISKYILYWLTSPLGKNEIQTKLIGSTQQALTIDAMKTFNIPLPPIEDQKRIASILSSFDDKIEVNRKICSTLEEMARLIFRQNFINHPDKETWQKGKLGDICNVTTGKNPLLKAGFSSDISNIPIAGASGIIGYTNNYLFDQEIITCGRVGTHGVINRYHEETWVSDNALIFIGQSMNFIYYFLKRIDYTQYNVGSTQPLITQTAIKNIGLSLPPEELLKDFEKTVTPMYEQIKILQSEINTLTTTRDILLPRLMKGEI